MFENINLVPRPPAILAQIEHVQHDFLAFSSVDLPAETEKTIDVAMEGARTSNSDEAYNYLEQLRITKYQNPAYQQEIAISSAFVIDCFRAHRGQESVNISPDDLMFFPFATIKAPTMTGFVRELDYKPDGSSKVPCIFISQHCGQTAWICRFVHEQLRSMASDEDWNSNFGKNEINIPAKKEVLDLVANETIKAFQCELGSSEVGLYLDTEPENIEASRLLVSFLLAHEYAHICLGHRAFRSDATPIALSSPRLNDLIDISQGMTQTQRLNILIMPSQLKYYFGHQQDELEADLVAFFVLYSGICDHDNPEERLGVFFRQVCYALLWGEIHEILGRTMRHGTDWYDEPLHSPDVYILSDISWRTRYPSPYSRLFYLPKRAQFGLQEHHLELFHEAVKEAEVLFAIWRKVAMVGASTVHSVAQSMEEVDRSLRESFVWRGLPASMKDSIGFNDPTEAFEVHRWQAFLGASGEE